MLNIDYDITLLLNNPSKLIQNYVLCGELLKPAETAYVCPLSCVNVLGINHCCVERGNSNW